MFKWHLRVCICRQSIDVIEIIILFFTDYYITVLFQIYFNLLNHYVKYNERSTLGSLVEA